MPFWQHDTVRAVTRNPHTLAPPVPQTHSYLNTSHSLAWLVSRERNNDLHVNVCFADLLSIPSFWDDHRTHITNVVVDLLNIEDSSVANEVTNMAVSYYASLGNQTLMGKFVDVSTGNWQWRHIRRSSGWPKIKFWCVWTLLCQYRYVRTKPPVYTQQEATRFGCVRLGLPWSQRRHNTTVWTDSR